MADPALSETRLLEMACDSKDAEIERLTAEIKQLQDSYQHAIRRSDRQAERCAIEDRNLFSKGCVEHE